MKANKYKKLIYIISAGVILGAIYFATDYADRKNKESPIVVTVLPDLGADFSNGKTLYETNCSGCHGVSLGGKKGMGPPFVHGYYAPGHHSDVAFYRAISQGVIAHHWQFGNMPAVIALTQEDASDVISYIRAVQRANGIK